jgi:hypothetical protein
MSNVLDPFAEDGSADEKTVEELTLLDNLLSARFHQVLERRSSLVNLRADLWRLPIRQHGWYVAFIDILSSV